jgi:hypothetical protein
MKATVEDMKAEIRTALANGQELDEIDGNSGEWVDGYLPVYNNRIIEEWQNMPGGYDDRGGQELGHMGETTIIGLMSLDLYLYYTDLFAQAIEEIIFETENKGK